MKKWTVILNFSVIVFAVGFWGAMPVSRATGDFEIIANNPIFSASNVAPGDQFESNLIIRNTDAGSQQVKFKVSVTASPENITDYLHLGIYDENGLCVTGCDGKQNLTILNNSEIKFGESPAGSEKKYKLILVFIPPAENGLLGVAINFKMALAFTGTGNPKINNSEKDILSADQPIDSSNSPAAVVAAGVVSRAGLPSPRNSIGENNLPSDDSAQGKTAGGKIAGVEVNLCKEFIPLSIWILFLLLYSAAFNYASFGGGQNKSGHLKLTWFWQTLFTFALLIAWCFFEKCRLYKWYPYAVILISIISFFVYFIRLRKKIEGTKKVGYKW